ncbi:uncharacterized protein [Ptychodera flava]|uniref:uncharacterized protein n=1 Tax=Ptychodera flava TaxID=63121 RepID=UPI00396A1788
MHGLPSETRKSDKYSCRFKRFKWMAEFLKSVEELPHEKSEALIKKCKLPDWLIGANSCAIRVSYSFIASGRKFNDIKKGECNWAQVVNGDGDKYIIRVATMRCYMESRKGPADIVSSSQSAFTGSKGLIVFQDCNFATATGHVDLWDGSKCAGTCYFSNCSNIRLFKF